MKKEFDVIIIGAGAAGLGVGVLLERLGLNYTILEKHEIGASFKKWPKETRFISPSFTGNFFNMPDLNAISPNSSPAYTLSTEHPSGREYAKYLEDIAKHYKLHIETGIAVKHLNKENNIFSITTNKGIYTSKIAIWAAGEFQYPKTEAFKGEEHCIHFSNIESFEQITGDEAIIIGAYESGFDAAINFSKSGKEVTILDGSNYLEKIESDSSYALSPHTKDRIKQHMNYINYHKKTRVKEVLFENEEYIVKTSKDTVFKSKHKPINCTGFNTSLTLVEDLFEFEEGYPVLTEFDESTKTKHLFLVGPQVKHSNALFCFIYKYRQRFAIVAERIAKQQTINPKLLKEVIDEYKNNSFYLSDLSCCDEECEC